MVNFAECINDLMRIFYNRKFPLAKDDTGLSKNAQSIKDYYKGYPYIVRWDYDKTWKNANLDAASFWCQENCVGKFTTHIHRVTQTSLFGTENEWRFDDIAGTDYCFWAFEKEEDAIMFSLVW